MSRLVMAFDLGTTGTKASLHDAEGALVGSAFEGYATVFEGGGRAEQDPEDWWRAVRHTSRALLSETEASASDVACLAFSGQMMGCVAIDARGHALRRALIWADGRAGGEVRALAERIDPRAVYRTTGHRLSASYSLAKILWLRRHEPDTFGRAHAFVNAKDAVVARLTGRVVTDPSDASGTNLYDLEGGGWSEAILEAAELDPARLPEVVPSTEVVGGLLDEAATALALAPGTPVVIGGGDGSCAATGAGVVAEGAAYGYIGSSSWLALASREPVYDPAERTFTWAHLVPGVFSPCGTMQAAGASYQWARDQLAPLERQAAALLGESAYALMNLAAERSPVGAGGLLYLPYLLGERSPRWDPEARGAFVGLDVRHTRADLLRAVLEGVAMNLRVILDALTAQGARVEGVRLIGGGARGRLWRRIMADVFGVPTERLRLLEEATSLGAAVAGGVGVGLYPGFEVATRANPVTETEHPDPGRRDAYARLLPLFEAAYHALEPVYAGLGEWRES